MIQYKARSFICNLRYECTVCQHLLKQSVSNVELFLACFWYPTWGKLFGRPRGYPWSTGFSSRACVLFPRKSPRDCLGAGAWDPRCECQWSIPRREGSSTQYAASEEMVLDRFSYGDDCPHSFGWRNRRSIGATQIAVSTWKLCLSRFLPFLDSRVTPRLL